MSEGGFPSTLESLSTASARRTASIPRTVAYYIAFIALGLVSGSLGPTLPGLADHTRSRLAEISSLFAARSLGYFGGSLFGGRLYDRIPGHLVMAGCLVCMAAMMFLAPLMTWLWHLVAVILVLGASDGALDVGGNTLLVWVHGEKVGPFMNGLHFFFGVGAFLSPVIIAQAMLGGGGIGRAYRVLAILLLPGALWLLRLASPAMPARSADSAADRVNGRLVGLIVVFFFFYSGAEIGFGGWIYSYATALHLSSDTVAAYLTSAFWGSLTVGRLLAIPIALRLTPRLVLLIDLLGSLISVCAFLLWPYSLVIAWLGTCGMGLSLASVFPATMCLAQGRMRIRGKVTGWFFVGVSAGGMFLPWFIGQFFESVGPRTTMVILLFDLIGGVALLAVLAFQVGRPVYQWVMGEG